MKSEKLPAHRPRKYDWPKWFSKRKTVLRRGFEYQCDTIIMAQQVHNAARRYHRIVQVREHPYGLEVTVSNPGREESK